MAGRPSLAQLLRELRESRGLSARRIEQLGGPTRKMVGEYEAGTRVPTEATIRRLLRVLDVPDHDPQAARVLDAINPTAKGLPEEQYGKLVDAMVELVLRLDGRPRTDVLVLNARNDVMAVMRQTIGGPNGDGNAKK